MAELTDQVPLVIGVTGHRDPRPQDVPRLEQEFERIIERLREQYRNADGSSGPILLISALAEGADRIAARVALKLGVDLVAALPLPPDEYKRDFVPGLSPGASAEFDDLRGRAIASPVMGWVSGNTPDNVQTDQDKRALQYRAVGLFIVQHCDVLIAFWDGDERGISAGGTAEVVTFKRDGIPLAIERPARTSLDGSEIGPVIHIVTPRVKAGTTASDVSVRPWGEDIIARHRGNAVRRAFDSVKFFAFRLIGLEPSITVPSAKEWLELEAWERFEALNDLKREFNSEPNEPSAVQESVDSLFVDPDTNQIDPAGQQRANAIAPHWCRFFGVADSLARRRQAQFRRDWTALFCLSFVGFILFVLAGFIDAHNQGGLLSKLLLGGYTVVFAIVFALFIRARIRRDQERFLDYRAFAEALRVAVYWRILGIDGSEPGGAKGDLGAGIVSVVSHYYPIRQPNELAWVKVCLRILDLQHPPEGALVTHGFDERANAIARHLWVRGQLAYFERQSRLRNRHAEMLESWSTIVLIITPFFLVPLLLSARAEREYFGMEQRDIFLVATGILPGIAAALAGYSERLALTGQAHQYERMRLLFQRANEILPDHFEPTAAPSLLRVYRELGIETMKESVDWVSIYRQRPIKPIQ